MKPKVPCYALTINNEGRILYQESEKKLLLKKVEQLLDLDSTDNTNLAGFRVDLTTVDLDYYDSLPDHKEKVSGKRSKK